MRAVVEVLGSADQSCWIGGSVGSGSLGFSLILTAKPPERWLWLAVDGEVRSKKYGKFYVITMNYLRFLVIALR